MIFTCQKESIDQLNSLASARRQSVLIEGPSGCGKTYLAREYSKMVDVPDFQVVEPKVDTVRSAVETCLNLGEPIVLCIENLDIGTPAASYALLKFLEEPSPGVYIIVTCRNIRNIPDTIVSRSTLVTVSPPIASDIERYSEKVNAAQYQRVKDARVWNCVRTFKDAELVMSMDDSKLRYFESLSELAKFNDSVTNIVWKLGHYDDNSDSPVELVIRYLMDIIDTPFIRKCGIDCIRDLSLGRIATHAVLAKFAFNVRYCE